MQGFWRSKGHLTRIWFIALLVFALNQGIEFVHLQAYSKPYSVLCDWDCPWYSSIVNSGYDLAPHAHERGDAANWAFFPAFPMAAKFLATVGDWPPRVALIMTSKLFFLLAIFAFIRFAERYSPSLSPWVAGAVVALHPYALYGNVGYTESMYLFFSCLCLLAAREQRFLTAGLLGAVLSAVRLAGVFIVFALLMEAIRRLPKAGQTARLQMLLGILLVPVGLSIFMIFLHQLMGDALAFSHVQIAWNRIPTNPLVHLFEGLRATDPLRQLWAVMALAALCMTVWLIRQGEFGLAIFALFATLIPLSTGLSAIPRYLWWQAPLLLVLAQCVGATLGQVVRPLRLSQDQPDSRPWWHTLPISIFLIPLSIWGLSLMYRAWIIRESYVI